MERGPQPLKRHIAQLLKAVPWAAAIGIWLVRSFRGRFTAGVVGVILNSKGDLLLVEHVFHPTCAWGLPGGWIERGESPAEALRREVREELGMEMDVLSLLLIEPDPWYRSHLDIAYLCRTSGAVAHLSPELLDYRWMSADVLPPLVPFHRAAVEQALRQRCEGSSA